MPEEFKPAVETGAKVETSNDQWAETFENKGYLGVLKSLVKEGRVTQDRVDNNKIAQWMREQFTQQRQVLKNVDAIKARELVRGFYGRHEGYSDKRKREKEEAERIAMVKEYPSLELGEIENIKDKALELNGLTLAVPRGEFSFQFTMEDDGFVHDYPDRLGKYEDSVFEDQEVIIFKDAVGHTFVTPKVPGRAEELEKAGYKVAKDKMIAIDHGQFSDLALREWWSNFVKNQQGEKEGAELRSFDAQI